MTNSWVPERDVAKLGVRRVVEELDWAELRLLWTKTLNSDREICLLDSSNRRRDHFNDIRRLVKIDLVGDEWELD